MKGTEPRKAILWLMERRGPVGSVLLAVAMIIAFGYALNGGIALAILAFVTVVIGGLFRLSTPPDPLSDVRR